MTDPETIAKGLPSYAAYELRRVGGTPAPYGQMRGRSRVKLFSLKLLETHELEPEPTFRITDLGLAVRAILERDAGNG